MKKLLPLILLFCTLPTFAQDVLTNESVVEMVKSGIPESVIVTKIKNSAVKFNTGAVDLKALADAKIPDVVISAMIEKQAEPPKAPPKIEYTGENPEYGSLAEARTMKRVYVESSDIKAREIIVNALSKYPGLTVVGNKDDAEFKLTFLIGQQNTGASVFGGSVVTDKNIIGELYAITRGTVDTLTGKGRIKILWSTRKVQVWSGIMTIDKHPASSAIGRFLKELKKLRGEN